MWLLYILALIPSLIGGILLIKNKNISIIEWLVGTAIGLISAAFCHFLFVFILTSDYETWSGEIVKIEHHPAWTEQYTEHHSETDNNGNTRYWTTIEHDHHPEHWLAYRDFGDRGNYKNIDEQKYLEIKQNFGNNQKTFGTQIGSHGGICISGDDNIYGVNNETDYKYPVTDKFRFTNKIKASPSLFSYIKVNTNYNVFDYPENADWMQSDRLLGTAANFIDIRSFDLLNSRLGPIKKVNVIMIGFIKENQDIALYQEAKWLGGKKNDLVICFGGGRPKQPATWVHTFGWTEKDIVKHNINSILLSNPINDNILPLIEKEIRKNYMIKDFDKFDYISASAPTWLYFVFSILLVLSQTGLYYWFNKEGSGSLTYRANRYNLRRFNRFML